jgi:hypothetical protein
VVCRRSASNGGTRHARYVANVEGELRIMNSFDTEAFRVLICRTFVGVDANSQEEANEIGLNKLNACSFDVSGGTISDFGGWNLDEIGPERKCEPIGDILMSVQILIAVVAAMEHLSESGALQFEITSQERSHLRGAIQILKDLALRNARCLKCVSAAEPHLAEANCMT